MSNAPAIRSFGSARSRSMTILSMLHGKNEIVRARCRDGKLLLHKGADRYIELPWQDTAASKLLRRATRDCAGCNRSLAARITSPARVSESI